MDRFLTELRKEWEKRPFVWVGGAGNPECSLQPPETGQVLVLAPHPDDPESVAVTCRLLMGRGCRVCYAIVTDSPAGVEDSFCQNDPATTGTALVDRKVAARRGEQRRAARGFGLAPDALVFLGLAEGGAQDSAATTAGIGAHLEAVAPDVVLMPLGEDTNRTHALVHKVFRQCAGGLAKKLDKPILGLYFEDPKTTRIQPDLYVLFDPESAAWKGSLLRIHDSQQQRNLHQRGRGLDEHILATNREARARLPESSPASSRPEPFAEVFELELFEPA